MKDLIAKMEQAGEGSRKLDAEIAFQSGWHVDNNDNWIGPQGEIVVPHYTTSLDAALTLYNVVPDVISTDPIKACIEGLKQHG